MARLRAPRGMTRSRGGLLALLPLVAGGALLVAAEPLELRSLRVGSGAGARVVAGSGETAGAHHGYALAVLGVALVLLGAAAVVRGSRAAGAGALLVAVIAAWIAVVVDHAALDDTGLVGPSRVLAHADAGPAWRVEVVGVVLALAGAGWACAAVARREREPAAFDARR